MAGSDAAEIMEIMSTRFDQGERVRVRVQDRHMVLVRIREAWEPSRTSELQIERGHALEPCTVLLSSDCLDESLEFVEELKTASQLVMRFCKFLTGG